MYMIWKLNLILWQSNEDESIHPLKLLPCDKAVPISVNPSECSLLKNRQLKQIYWCYFIAKMCWFISFVSCFGPKVVNMSWKEQYQVKSVMFCLKPWQIYHKIIYTSVIMIIMMITSTLSNSPAGLSARTPAPQHRGPPLPTSCL